MVCTIAKLTLIIKLQICAALGTYNCLESYGIFSDAAKT